MNAIKEIYDNKLDTNYVAVSVKRPKKVDPFKGEPYAIWCYESDKGDSYYRAVHKYRNVICIDKLSGNEDLILSATWILTDNKEILNFKK